MPGSMDVIIRVSNSRKAARMDARATSTECAMLREFSRGAFKPSSSRCPPIVHPVLARRRGLRVRYEVAEPDSGLPEVADPGGDGPPLDIERAIAALPEGARHVLVLVSIYGFSHAEAAQTLGIAEGTCKAQLHRARGLLAAALGVET